MADPLYELLAPYFDQPDAPSANLHIPRPGDFNTASYLARLSTLSLADLVSSEPASLLQAAQSHVRNLQALTKRTHRSVIESSSHLSSLSTLLPDLQTQANNLREEVPKLESAASDFARKYDRSTENEVLDRRKQAMLLARNVDRVSDVLDLPTLLSSTVAAAQTSSTSSAVSSSTSYTSALDLQAHIKRLNALYPQSKMVGSIGIQAEKEMQNMTSMLIASLRSPQLKLAGAMRTIGWLRRVAPDLAANQQATGNRKVVTSQVRDAASTSANRDGALGSLFLLCRLQTLHKMLEALSPLRDLADQETSTREQSASGTAVRRQSQPSAFGNQTERYLKRYIEIFREQSFGIISMYKSIFPTDLPTTEHDHRTVDVDEAANSLIPLPSPLANFTMHLVDLLTRTLTTYMRNVGDKSSRESLLTQVLYCAGSLGRLGADFGMVVAQLEEARESEKSTRDPESAADEDDMGQEWVTVMKKHRVQASRLEILARGVGTGRKGSADVSSPVAVTAM